MKKVLPLLADIGHGILATLAVGLYFGTPLSWHFLVGVAFAFLPDIDAVPRILRTGSVTPTEDHPQDHRDFLHFPILFGLAGMAVYFVSPFWSCLFLLAVGLHFLNDTWGNGDGVMWLWPFSKRKFEWSAIDHMHLSKQQKDYSHVVHDRWINDTYLRFTLIAAIEYTTFLCALIALSAYFWVL